MSENQSDSQAIEKTVYETVRSVTDRLTPLYGRGEAKAMARIIFANLKGWTPVDLAIKANETLTGYMSGKIDAVVDRLLRHEPIQYIFGNTVFYGLKIGVTRDTLIPRPETAELVDIIVRDNSDRKDLRVLDIATGSGCIALALARNLPFADVTATDISAGALDVARANARDLKARVDFIEADILKGEPAGEGPFDIIVSNPPYIADSERADMDPNVLDFEPHSALFVPDSDPLEFYRAILESAADALAPGGTVYFEINPLFADRLVDMARNAGWSRIDIQRDSFGKQRFAIISK